MRVSWIYRALMFMFIGFAIGTFVTAKAFIKNMPPSTQIEIGKVKVRGKGNTVESVMNVEDVTTEETNIKNKKNRRKEQRESRRNP